jgi:5-methylcytosine-specific restriction endonuclease McrA
MERARLFGQTLGMLGDIGCPANPRKRLHNPVTRPYKLGLDAALRQVSRDRNVVLNAHVSPSGFPALVLNADFRPLSYYPLSLWSWQDAIKAVFLERVNIVANYDRAVRSPSFEMKLPSVVSLKTFVKPSTHPAFTRFNVFLRDRFSCQYCGARDDLTFDHLLPRSRGGHTTWDNVVAACSPCNLRKGNLTTDESKMWPSQRPFQPSVQHLHRNGRLFPPNYLHDSWLDYLYWDTELDP